jgi:hypothetical protein
MQRVHLVPIGLAHKLQGFESLVGFVLVDLGYRKPHMDQNPITGLEVLVFEQADIDGTSYTRDVDAGQGVMTAAEFQYLSRDP